MPRAPSGRRKNPPVLKKYGQHFLSDKNILGAIVDALAPEVTDTVLEIGPGRGSLTDILIERSGRVVAIEIDRALAEQLGERYRDRANVQIVQGMRWKPICTQLRVRIFCSWATSPTTSRPQSSSKGWSHRFHGGQSF